jgi:hypothetical protein
VLGTSPAPSPDFWVCSIRSISSNGAVIAFALVRPYVDERQEHADMRILVITLVLVDFGCSEVKAPPLQIDAPTAVTLDCTTYCNELERNCTGLNAQYPDIEHCIATCASVAPGALSDTFGNTLGCRIYHAGAPAKATPTIHCIHGGPAGAQTDAAAGQCGDACTSFCSLNLAICTGGLAQYADMATCLVACSTGNPTATPPIPPFNKTSKYIVDTTKTPTAIPTGNSLACRLYHTTNAALDAAHAMAHCGHTAQVPAAGTPCSAPIP